MKHTGSCHCQSVMFEVELPDNIECERCNCSICAQTGFIHCIIPSTRFTLLKGSEYLSEYRFNSNVAVHTFCKICGVKPFYTPRSNPDGVSVNLNCLHTYPENVEVVEFDGQNWEQNAASLAHKSKI